MGAYTALLDWMIQNGGHLHEGVQIAHDERRGVHLQVKKDWEANVPRDTCIIKTPVAATMSYFNAIDKRLSDESAGGDGLFSAHGLVFPRSFVDAIGPEETTVFFLMGQYLQEAESFWHPWIQTLPQPGSLTTPLYYEGEDLKWLEGTSLLPAREQKMEILREKFDGCHQQLRNAGFGETERYTW